MPEHIQEVIALSIVGLAAASIVWRFLGVFRLRRSQKEHSGASVCPHGCECGPSPAAPALNQDEVEPAPGWTEPARVH